jgi:hypothetical protein
MTAGTLTRTGPSGKTVPGGDEPRLGLRLAVYRPVGTADHTLGGITSRAARLTGTTIREVGPGGTQGEYPVPERCRVFAPCPGAPEVVLVVRHRPGECGWVHLEPAGNPGWHYMHGGNYAGSHDTRWRGLSGAGLVAVHDRHEGRGGDHD